MKNSKTNQAADQAMEEHIAQDVKRREEAEKGTLFLREMFFLILLAALSAILVVLSLQLFLKKPEANGPGTYPLIASAGMVLCCLVAVIQLIKKHRTKEEHTSMKSLKLFLMTEVPFTVFIMMIATAAYVVGITLAGFYLSTSVYMFFSAFFLFEGKKEKLLQSFLVGVGTAFAVWLIIDKIFQIHMP